MDIKKFLTRIIKNRSKHSQWVVNSDSLTTTVRKQDMNTRMWNALWIKDVFDEKSYIVKNKYTLTYTVKVDSPSKQYIVINICRM